MLRTVCQNVATGAFALLLMGCSPAADPEPSADGREAAAAPTMLQIDQIGIEDGRGVYVARRDRGDTRITFDLPADRLNPERRHDTEQVGETPSGIVVLLDRYASNPGQDARCRDGRETFLRIFSLQDRREVESRVIESCLDRIVAPDPAVTWLGGGRFRIEGPVPATFGVTEQGRVDQVKMETPRG